MFDKFIVISVGDDRKDIVKNIVSTLGSGNQLTGIDFVDARNEDVDPFLLLNSMGVATDVYAPDDGRSMPMKRTEAGIFCSYIRALEAGAARSTGNVLILEDDAILAKNFVSQVNEFTKDLPEHFDFLSLYSLAGQNFIVESSDIGSRFIHRCVSQFAMNVGILWSQVGIRKILDIFRQHGTTYNSDSIIYRASREGLLAGFIVRPDVEPVIFHGTVPSILDPNNERNV